MALILDLLKEQSGNLAPNITSKKIKDEKRFEKDYFQIPDKLVNVIKCENPRCITSIEQELPHVCELTDKEKGIYRCKYCEEQVQI